MDGSDDNGTSELLHNGDGKLAVSVSPPLLSITVPPHEVDVAGVALAGDTDHRGDDADGGTGVLDIADVDVPSDSATSVGSRRSGVVVVRDVIDVHDSDSGSDDGEFSDPEGPLAPWNYKDFGSSYSLLSNPRYATHGSSVQSACARQVNWLDKRPTLYITVVWDADCSRTPI